MRFNKKNYYIKRIEHAEAEYFIKNFHYAKGCSNTCVFAFGLFAYDKLDILGVSLWMNAPCGVAKKYTSTFMGGKPVMNTVLTLSRFVLDDSLLKNAASFFLSKCIKRIQKTGKYDCLVTYADQRVGHIGTIYRASNWEYDGETAACAGWIDDKGILKSRLCTNGKTAAEMDSKYRRTAKNKKYRFIYKLKRRERQQSLFAQIA